MSSQEKAQDSFSVKAKELAELLKTNIEIIVPENGLEKKLEWSLKNNKKLNVKLGFDPTAPDLHLGHAVVLKKLKEFQDLGHQVKVIIGDFTAYIGDPTGRNKTRPPLSEQEIESNAKTYLNQLSKILDLSKVDVNFNTEWFNKMSLRDTIRLLSKFTVAQMMQRTDFHNRFSTNTPISLHELAYPLLQGYDSIMIDADIEMGGTDQLFNCMVGKDMQDIEGKPSQAVICMSLLRGTDGVEKMSKSKNNYIGLTEHPNDMYGKTMSIGDDLIVEYIHLVTNFSIEKKSELIQGYTSGTMHPMELKKAIAYNIVEQFHSLEDADAAAEFFYKQIQQRNPDEITYTDVTLSELGITSSEIPLLDLCFSILKTESRSQIRRLIQGGGVSVEQHKKEDPAEVISLSELPLKLKLGKRSYFRVIS